MRNVSDKNCTEIQNTHFVFSNFFSPLENRAVYETMWKNTVEPNRPNMTICRMRIAFRITKATNTHSEYLIPTAFTLQQWRLVITRENVVQNNRLGWYRVYCRQEILRQTSDGADSIVVRYTVKFSSDLLPQLQL